MSVITPPNIPIIQRVELILLSCASILAVSTSNLESTTSLKLAISVLTFDPDMERMSSESS